MTLTEAAKHLGIPPSTLERWAWDGVGPVTVGRRRFNNVQYERNELDAWLKANAEETGAMLGTEVHPWPAPVKPYQRPVLSIKRDANA